MIYINTVIHQISLQLGKLSIKSVDKQISYKLNQLLPKSAPEMNQSLLKSAIN